MYKFQPYNSYLLNGNDDDYNVSGKKSIYNKEQVKIQNQKELQRLQIQILMSSYTFYDALKCFNVANKIVCHFDCIKLYTLYCNKKVIVKVLKITQNCFLT
jgi:hypothetical protein